MVAAPAYAIGQGQPRVVVDGPFVFLSGGAVKIGDGDVFTLGAEAKKRLEGLIQAGIVKEGTWLRLVLDSDGSVRDLTVTEAPRDASRPPAPVDPKRGEREALARSLKPGDIVLVNGVKYEFEIYLHTTGVLVLRVLGAQGRGSVTFDLSQIRSIERLSGGSPGAAPPGGAGERPPVVASRLSAKPGDTVSVNGIDGYVLSVDEEAKKIALNTRDGSREFAFDEITDIHPIPKEQLEGVIAGVRAPVATAGETERLSVEHDRGSLDWTANTWTVRGAARNSIGGRVAIGVVLYLEARGQGRLLTPREEAELMRNMGSDLPEFSGTFSYLGSTYFIQRNGADAVIADLSELPQRDRRTLPAIFPGVAEPFEWPCPIFNPSEFDVRLEYDESNLVAYSDPRAVPALIAACDGDSAHREAALRAIAASRNEAFLPYLLYQFHQEPGEAPAVRAAVVAFGEAADRWLVKFLDERGFEKELAIPTASGQVEKKKIRDTQRLIARTFELLSALGSIEAFRIALPYTRDADEELRASARALFLDHVADASRYLIRRLAISTEAQQLMLELDEKEPGTLRNLYSNLRIDDPDLEREIQGEPDEFVRRKLLARIQKEMSSGGGTLQLPPEILAGRDALGRIRALQEELRLLREELSRRWLAKAVETPPGKDMRQWRTEALRRAVVLDDKNREARGVLASVYVEMAQEVRQGVALRAGPGVEYRVVRILKKGDAISAASDLVAAPRTAAEKARAREWAPVRLSDGTPGFVARDSIRETAPGSFVVERSVRPYSVVADLLLRAKSLDPDSRRIDEVFADVRADEAKDAAEAGDWKRAFALYREASTRAPGRYRTATIVAFIRANPVFPAIAGVLALVAIVAWLSGRSSARASQARAGGGGGGGAAAFPGATDRARRASRSAAETIDEPRPPATKRVPS